jgi:pimeloyl-ACP methyl ester carboxylesterase
VRETEIIRDGRVMRVRDAGDPDGAVVMYFHGTPSSRLDICFGDSIAAGRGVRLVSFDRPGYGGSAAAPFGLASIATDAHAIADELGIARFATLGWSGGGPFALAAASVGASRVIRAGVAAGAGPDQEVPGALERLDSNDRAALGLLLADPVAAAPAFAAGLEPLVELSRVAGNAELLAAFEDLMSARDKELLGDPRFTAALADTVRESLRQGSSGYAWDNVSIGTWDIDLSAIRCPVLLWHGSDDQSNPPVNARWLAEHLLRAQLVMLDGEGHLVVYEHLGEMLDALTQPDTPAGPLGRTQP